MDRHPPEMDSVFTAADDGRLDWKDILALSKEFSLLEDCPQDPLHHSEGNVGIHTRMVLDALLSSPEWRKLEKRRRRLLFWAAAFHDIGKPATTEISPEGRVTAPGHSRAGAAITRYRLREAGYPLAEREGICNLIRFHQLPFWLFERDDALKQACMVSLTCSASLLLMHALADAVGRECADKNDLLDRVELSRVVFQDLGISDGPFIFPNDESRVSFFEKEARSSWYEAHEEFRCEATLVCGLPGTGKDTWIMENCSDRPSVSLDRIRERLKIHPEDNQGKVVQAAFEEAKSYLRSGTDFVWNATNVTRSNREKVLRLLRDYNARIRIVYLEASPGDVISRNRNRDASVPESVIEKLARKLEPPYPHEGHTVEWHSDGIPVAIFGTPLAAKVSAPR